MFEWIKKIFGIKPKPVFTQQKVEVSYAPDAEQPQPEAAAPEIVPNAITENRIKILRVQPQLFIEMLIQGRKNAFEVIQRGLPEDTIVLVGIDDGGYDAEGYFNFTLASPSWPVYSQEPVDGKVPMPEYLDVPQLKALQLGPNQAVDIQQIIQNTSKTYPENAQAVTDYVNAFIRPVRYVEPKKEINENAGDQSK